MSLKLIKKNLYCITIPIIVQIIIVNFCFHYLITFLLFINKLYFILLTSHRNCVYVRVCADIIFRLRFREYHLKKHSIAIDEET